MRDIARASITDITHSVSIENKKGEKSTYIKGEGYAFDPTFEAVKKATEMFPGYDLSIASLGTGEPPRQFGTTTLHNVEIPIHLMKSAQHRHLNYLGYLEEPIIRGNQKVDYCRIQLTLDPSITGKDALRQAGLYVSNPINGKVYITFEKIITELEQAYTELEQAYKEYPIFPPTPPNEDPNHRRWEAVTGDVFPPDLPDRPVGFIESAAEGSNKSYLSLLQEELCRTGAATISFTRATLAGMGGIGKTYLALRCAYNAWDNKAYNRIYWLPSEELPSLIEKYRNLLQDIAPEVSIKDANDERIIGLVKQYLPKKGKCLLIYDNVPYPDFLKNKIPQTGDVHILVTSRCNYGWDNNPINLDVFRPEDSIKYLLNITDLSQPSEEDQCNAGKLAEEMGHLPLALSHARSYINYRRISDKNFGFADYLSKFTEQSDTIYKTRYPSKNPAIIDHEYLIFKTWNMAAEMISDPAKKLMGYFAYLAPDSIAKDIFLGSMEKDDIDLAFNELCEFSLIQPSQQFFSIHRLVQLVIRQEQEKDDHLSMLPSSICTILSCFGAYWQTLEQEAFLKENLEAPKLDRWYGVASTLQSNLTKLSDEHLQRFWKSGKIEENQIINIKAGALSLQYLFRKSLTSLRDEILKRMNQAESHKQGNMPLEKLLQEEFKEVGLEMSEKELESILPLLPSESRNRADVIEALGKVDAAQRPVLVESAKKLIDDMNGYALACVIEALGNINPVQCQAVVGCARKLITDNNIKGFERADIIKALSKIDAAQRQGVVESAKELMTDDMKGHERALVIEALSNMNPVQCRAFAESAKELMTDDMKGKGDGRGDIIKALSKVEAAQRPVVVESAKKLIDDMNGYALACVIEALSNMNPVQRRAFAGSARELMTDDMNGNTRAYIIKTLSKVDAAQRQAVVGCARELMTDNMIGQERAYIINTLRKVDAAQRQGVAGSAKELISDNMNRYDRWVVIKALRKVDTAQRQAVVGCARELMTDDMNGQERWVVIETLSKVDAAQRQAISAKVRFLLELSQKKDDETLLPQDKWLKAIITPVARMANLYDFIRIFMNLYSSVSGFVLESREKVVPSFLGLLPVTDDFPSVTKRAFRRPFGLGDHLDEDREELYNPPLPHHRTYGSVYGGSDGYPEYSESSSC